MLLPVFTSTIEPTAEDLRDYRQRMLFVLQATIADLHGVRFPEKSDESEQTLREVAHRLLVIGECLVWDAEVLGGRHAGSICVEELDDLLWPDGMLRQLEALHPSLTTADRLQPAGGAA